MTIDREWLKNTSAFPDIEDSILDKFLERATEVQFKDGELVFSEMDTFGNILMVTQGCLNHEFALFNFEQHRDLKATEGMFSNHVQFLAEAPNVVSCIAEGDVKVLSWDTDTWKEICSEHPEVGYKIAVTVGSDLVQRLLRLNQMLLDNVSWGLE